VNASYDTGEGWFVHAYTCMLASSTKARVRGTIAVDPRWSKRQGRVAARTYDEAAMQSIGTYNETTRRFDHTYRSHLPITLTDHTYRHGCSTEDGGVPDPAIGAASVPGG
jgi:hypothetical protein